MDFWSVISPAINVSGRQIMMKIILRYFVVLVLASFVLSANAAQTFGCLIEPYKVAEVGSQVIGVIETIKVERGDRVTKGQVIAVLRGEVERASVGAAHSRAEADANVKASEASLEFDRQRLKRGEGLLGKNFISKQAVDQIRAETEVSAQKLNQAREQQRIAREDLGVASAQLYQRTIRSPFDGVIAERYMSVGERIEEKPLVRVAKIDRLRVQVVVPVNYYGKIENGSLVSIVPDFPNAPTATGQVTLVDKVIDAASNTFRVQVDLANADLALPAGLRCKADFGLAQPASTENKPAVSVSPVSTSQPTKSKLLQMDRTLSYQKIAPQSAQKNYY